MSYEKFAYLYDELMKDVPYEKWVQMVLKKKEQYHVKGSELLDLACGTGELSVRLSEVGFDVTGVDLSEDMLTVASTKAQSKGLSLSFFQQDMAELELLSTFDIIGIFCDSLNYLQTEDEVKQTFTEVNKHLTSGGLFIFDVHSVFKVMQIFMNQTFTYDEEQLCYIWNCYPGEHPNCVEHELTFFVQDDTSGKYDRYDELHIQRTYPIDTYRLWLQEAGFECLEINADFEDLPPKDQAERIFFIARKNII